METTPTVVNDSLEKTIEELRTYEKKNLRIGRIRLLLSLFAVVLLAVIAIVAFSHIGRISQNIGDLSTVMTEAGENINVVATDLQKIDFAALGESAQAFADVGTETTQQIKDATKGLDTILSDAETAIRNLSKVNIDQLNADIQTLHDVLDPLAKFFNIFH